MRAGLLTIVALAVWTTGGCHISRHIVAIDRPRQPPLTELEDHLTYVDPDRGQSDYVVEPGEQYAAQSLGAGAGK